MKNGVEVSDKSYEKLVDFCTFLLEKNKNIPLYLTGSEDGFDYESKQKFDGLGITVLPPMSPIAAYVKLWLQ